MHFFRGALLLFIFSQRAWGVGIQVDVIPNFVGVGLGVTTEWLGSKDQVTGLVPGGRKQLENNRFIELYGPIFDMNVLDHPNWEFGPMVSFRFGRSDVKDPVVNLLPPIDGGLEAGVFAGWHHIRTEGIPYRLRLGVSLTTGITGGATGGHVTPYGSLWVPLSPTLFVGVGGGFTWSSDSFMQQRFGVSPDASAASGLPVYSAGGQEKSLFRDPEDGKLDASEWLLERKGFLPVPIIITEPAVGYGAGAALLFFRDSIGEQVTKAKESGRLAPPDIYGVVLAATENGTTAGGVFGMVTFGEQLWRYRGGVARPDVNLDFYGTNGTDSTQDFKLGYNVEGWISTQQIMRRLGQSENFIGARWIYLDLDTRFDASQPQPNLPPGGRAVRSSGLGLAFEHDSRDNFFTPSSGWKGYLESMFYSPDIGSDNKYEIYRAYAFGYLPLQKSFILGGRLDGRAARGDVPFYQLPFIELRGIPAARYQDENAGVAEVELRWNATPRWALIGFLGAGRAWGTTTNFGDADTVSSWGAGFRYLVARRLGIYMGVDLAKGPEETAIYVQAGSAWH